jgi:transposase
MTLGLLTVQAKNEILRRVLSVDLPSHRGRPRSLSTVETLERILYICRTGCQWSQLPLPAHVSYKTVHRRFMDWSKKRVFEDSFKNLAAGYARNQQKSLVVDSTFVKNVFGKEVIGRNHTDRGRRATKVSLLTDTAGVPIATTYQFPNKHDSTTLKHLLHVAQNILPHSISLHSALYADKAYDSQTCRTTCSVLGLVPMIPKRRTPDRLGSLRYVIETTFGRLDRFRRIIMRYDATIHAFKSFHSLACCCLFR